MADTATAALQKAASKETQSGSTSQGSGSTIPRGIDAPQSKIDEILKAAAATEALNAKKEGRSARYHWDESKGRIVEPITPEKLAELWEQGALQLKGDSNGRGSGKSGKSGKGRASKPNAFMGQSKADLQKLRAEKVKQFGGDYDKMGGRAKGIINDIDAALAQAK